MDIRNVPPSRRIERISVHPQDTLYLKSFFAVADRPTWKGHVIPVGVPIVEDGEVPAGSIVVREGGRDVTVPLPPRMAPPLRYVKINPGEWPAPPPRMDHRLTDRQ